VAEKENVLDDLNNATGLIHFGSVDLEMRMGLGHPLKLETTKKLIIL
jgi:hypothetical protein